MEGSEEFTQVELLLEDGSCFTARVRKDMWSLYLRRYCELIEKWNKIAPFPPTRKAKWVSAARSWLDEATAFKEEFGVENLVHHLQTKMDEVRHAIN